MRNRFRAPGIAFLLLLALPTWAAERVTYIRPTVVLVSLEGFRPDYLARIYTPNLHAIMARGIHAKYMIPSFPTETFPNDYTIVTGLYPAHDGIVGNNMFDPDLKLRFENSDPESQKDPAWWGGEPIWATAEKQGLRTAPLMWPGSLAERPGARPTYTEKSNASATPEDRVDTLIRLLDLPADERPQLLTLHLDSVDQAGRRFGPQSPQVGEAVRQADKAIGRLLTAFKQRGIEDQVNIIVVSDHGMARLSRKRVVFLDDYAAMNKVEVIDGSHLVVLRPKAGEINSLYDKLTHVKHAKAYLSTDLPERWHFSGSSRIAPILLVADDGWTITTHQDMQNHSFAAGGYGFDNKCKDMRGIFMAAGPGFQRGTMRPLADIQLYSMMCYLLNIVPAKNDGSLNVFKGVLTERTPIQPSRKLLAPWQKEWDEVAQLDR